MKIFQKVLTRLNITVLLILLQIIIFGIALYKFVNYLPAITAVSYTISILTVIFLVKKVESPAYKVSWIIVIMLLPISGGILYFLFGLEHSSKNLNKRMSNEHRQMSTLLNPDIRNPNVYGLYGKRVAGTLNYIQNISSYPAYNGTNTKYYPFGELMFEDMLKELSSAKKFIFMEYFIISESSMWDEILNILTKKAEEGIDIRLIYDDVGSLGLFTPLYLQKLKSANIKIVTFNPFVPLMHLVMNNRDHRKIMVIDGVTAFNGGINISDEYINKDKKFGVWKDTGIRLNGDACWSFTLMFIEAWNAFCQPSLIIKDCAIYKNNSGYKEPNDGFVQPFADSPLDTEQLGESVYIDILNQAKKYVYI
ncbi:MAG: phospholipase D-like domain-containing protein, partial [Clostridiales bacterium]|nr:phospholipase D-like domain-containing protein [Clostridiales bacterium]